MTNDDYCGSTDTTTGEPCQNPAGSCPWHNTNEPPETGRPTKLSHQRQEQIAGALEQGIGFDPACQAAGIDPNTGYRWLRRGEEQDEGEFCEFYERITRARGVGKYELSSSIVAIARENEDARTLLKYLQHIEGGEASNEDDLAGLNLVVPEIAQENGDD